MSTMFTSDEVILTFGTDTDNKYIYQPVIEMNYVMYINILFI